MKGWDFANMSDWQKLEADASFYDARCTQKENTFEELGMKLFLR